MKSSVIATSLCLGLLVSSAHAADVSIKGNVSETVEGSNNEFLVNSPSGSTLKSTTDGKLDFLAQTPDTSYLLNTDYSYYKYLGPGAQDTSVTWGTPASTRFTIKHKTLLDTYNVGASWNRVDVASTLFAQTGFSSGHGLSNTYNVFGGVTHDLSRLDTLTWSANASTVSYTDNSQTPYDDINSTINWMHTLSRTTTLNNSVYFDYFKQDNAYNSQRLFWKYQSGLQQQLSPRLTFSGDVDVVFVNSYQNGMAPAIPPGPPGVAPFQVQPGSGHSVFGDVALTYKPTKTTTVYLTAAEAVIPIITGQLQQSATIGLMVNHDINEQSNLSFFTQFAQTQTPNQIGQTSTVGASDFYTAQVSYGYRLTRDWRSNISYTYRQREDSTGLARSSTVLFSLSRDFTVLGNPAAIDEAEQDRARQRAQEAVGEVFPLYH